MKVDSQHYQIISNELSRYIQGYPSLKNNQLYFRHGKIQTRLQNLSQYFKNSSLEIEKTETSILKKYLEPGYFYKSGNVKPNLKNILQQDGSIGNASLSMNYSYRQCRLSNANKYSSAYIDADVGKFRLKANTECTLYKEKKFNPSLSLKADASLSLLSGTMGARVGTSNIYGRAYASGQVGTVYAKCEAVLSKAEQGFDLGVGASALKGEVEASFNCFGAKVSVTGSGSIGSAEANISYHHSSKEWEFGSKLGFIAGLGFKVKVSY